MTAQHTPGKLIFGIRAWSDDYSRMKPIQKPFDYTGPGYYENPGLYAEDGTEVVGCDEYSIFSSGEDARRLVACWNACDGLSTSFLEDVAKLRTEPLRDLVKETEAERDELLAALQALDAIGVLEPDLIGIGEEIERAVGLARAAIQKATKEQV